MDALIPPSPMYRNPLTETGYDWHQAHEYMPGRPWTGCPSSELAGFTLYHYCVSKAFGHIPDGERATLWLNELTRRMQPLPGQDWTAERLDQACLLAWLHADGLASPLALLAELDNLLGREALRLLSQGDAGSRNLFFQVLRYFSLRTDGGTPNSFLQIALDTWPGCLAQAPRLLSLVQGTAAELLICIRLARAGFDVTSLTLYVRNGVRNLLATKQKVDFSQQHYAVFPDKLSRVPGEYIFSAELNWSRGDLGQAILLYEAQTLLRDAELAKFADLVGLHTLLRTTGAATEVVNAPLYRGAAGVAQRYRQLYCVSQQPAYLKGYEFWLAQTQRRLRTELTHGAYPLEDSLRYGLTGVSLVLLSASTDVELGWENYLLGAA